MNKFFNKFKKPYFWPILPTFEAIFFPKNLTLSHTTSYRFLEPCQNLEKTNDTIPKKHLDKQKGGRTEGWKEGQTLFCRTLMATTGGPKNYFSLY